MPELIAWWRLRRLAAWQWLGARLLDGHDAVEARAKALLALIGLRN